MVLLSSAWGMGGTIRAALNMGGWMARSRPVEIVTTYRRRDEPFFGAFPPDVQVTALDDQRPGHEPRGARGAIRRALMRVPSVLIPQTDRLYDDFSLWTDVHLVRKLRRGGGTLIATRPGLNILVAQLQLPGYRTVGLEQMHLEHHFKSLQKLMKQHYHKLDALVALTEGDVAAYDKLLGGRLALARIPNTVRPLEGPEPDLSAPVVVAAGRFRAQKGFDYLIEAWASVAPRHPDWTLRIWGEGKLRTKFDAMIAEHGLEDSVEMPGAATDMGAAMAGGSIFALPSRFEGFPLILLEAMSKGLACVAADCPTGPRDIIEQRRNGILVEDRNPPALAEGLLEMIEDEELRRRCAAESRPTAEQYTIEVIGPMWDRFLDDLRAGRLVPSRKRREGSRSAEQPTAAAGSPMSR